MTATPPTAPVKPMSPKEFAGLIGVRSARWVSEQCRRKKIPTCPPHHRPYLIPRNALFKFTEPDTNK